MRARAHTHTLFSLSLSLSLFLSLSSLSLLSLSSLSLLSLLSLFSPSSLSRLAQHHAGVHSKEGVWAHTGERITLSTDALDNLEEDASAVDVATMKKQMSQLYKNATLLFDTWRAHMNVTKDAMKGYWRGQDEDWVADAREAAMDLWEERVRKAR